MAAINVLTKGQIIGLNEDLMKLISNADGTVLVTAIRADGTWTLKSEGVADAIAVTRVDAIVAMGDHAQSATGASFYTAQVQPGLTELP